MRKCFSCLLMILLVLGSIVWVPFGADAEEDLMNSKTRSTIYTPEKIANARENIEQYDWAKQERDAAVEQADQFLSHGHEFLWSWVTPQSLPRSLAVQYDLGSPITGKEFLEEYGMYGWELNPDGMQWKLKDPSSGYIFPTNDFGAYYESGLDEHGIFQPELADKSLLKNELYPEKGENWGVDDGFGWVDEDGNKWTFIAFYNHWNYRWNMYDAMESFINAYIYTGNMRYARAGTILLDRIADLYPDMDLSVYTEQNGYHNSTGGTGHGKMIGSIWENFPAMMWIRAYDAFYPAMDNPEIVDFLSKKAAQYQLDNPKDSGTAIRKNIEDGILREIYTAVKKTQIRGNFGHHQSTLAMAAVVMDEPEATREWLDFVFQPGGLERTDDAWGWRTTGGEVLNRLVSIVDRDGMGDEASPEYNRIWLTGTLRVADVLDGYDRYPDADLYRNVKFKKMFDAHYPLAMIGTYSPQIGDTGSVAEPSLYLLNKDHYIKAFQEWGDPIFAQLAYDLNGNSTEGIHGDIFSEDPDSVAEEIQSVINTYGTWKQESVNMAGYGFAALQDGALSDDGDTRRGMWMYYGRNSHSHPHKDALNIDMYAYGLDLAPDLGYPEKTGSWPKRHEWTDNTISHNTVIVDKAGQEGHWVGTPRHYDVSENVQLMDVEAPQVYPQTEMYRRTTAMIKVDNEHSYSVDFFRVKGGNDHHFSFHGTKAEVATEGLNLVPQPTGTYAGPDVEFGEKVDDSGFHYLKNVEKDENPSSVFSVDWDVEDFRGVLSEPEDIHLRLTMIGELDEVAIADGEPPQRDGNPEALKYLLAHRSGENLDSLFTSVIEPYKDDRYIESISPATMEVDGETVSSTEAAAVKVELKNGRVDYIVNSLDPNVTYTVDDTFSFKGFFGVYSMKDDEPVYGYLNNGNKLGEVAQTETSALTGTVADFTKDLSIDNEIVADLDQAYESLDELVGSYIYVENDGVRNGSYRIEGVKEQDGNRVTFEIGDITLVRSYADTDDFSKGFKYNITEGSDFTIPLATEREIVTVSLMLDTLDEYREELSSEEAYRSLKIHLTAVERYEQQEATAKVVKHMKGFNLLLEHQKEKGMISDKAYSILKDDSDALIVQMERYGD